MIKFICEFIDEGRCYHSQGTNAKCPGSDECTILNKIIDRQSFEQFVSGVGHLHIDIKAELIAILRNEEDQVNNLDETGRTIEAYEEHPQTDAKTDYGHQEQEKRET